MSMAGKAQDITPTELAMLRILWKRGPCTIRELTDRLYPGGGQSHYATVQSLLDRLERKSCVSRQKHGRVNVYTSTVSRGDLIRRRLRGLAEILCDGARAPLLSHLVTEDCLSPDELKALEILVQRLDDEDRQSAGDVGQ